MTIRSEFEKLQEFYASGKHLLRYTKEQLAEFDRIEKDWVINWRSGIERKRLDKAERIRLESEFLEWRYNNSRV